MKNYETPLNVLLLSALAVITVLMASSLIRTVPDAVVVNVEQALPEATISPSPPIVQPPVVTETPARQQPAPERPKVTTSLKTLQSLISTPVETAPPTVPL